MDYIPILLFFANSEFMVFLWMHGFHQHVRILSKSCHTCYCKEPPKPKPKGKSKAKAKAKQ